MNYWIAAISLAASSIIAIIAYLWGRRKADYNAGYNSAQIESYQTAEKEQKDYVKKAAKIDKLCTTHRQRLRNWWNSVRKKNYPLKIPPSK